jgi:hypothetical protein
MARRYFYTKIAGTNYVSKKVLKNTFSIKIFSLLKSIASYQPILEIYKVSILRSILTLLLLYFRYFLAIIIFEIFIYLY